RLQRCNCNRFFYSNRRWRFWSSILPTRLRYRHWCCNCFCIFILITATKDGLKKGPALAGRSRRGRACTSGACNLHRGRAYAALIVSHRLLITGKRLTVRRQVNSIALRENSDEFLAAHAWPCAYAADIKMHERRSRGRIEANATNLKLHSNFTQPAKFHTRDIKVHRL